MSGNDDVLWNPRAGSDAELQQLEALLAPYRVQTRLPQGWTPPGTTMRPRRRLRRVARVFAAAIAASLLLVSVHLYRLAWSEGQPWSVTREAGALAVSAQLAPGEQLRTGATDSLRLAVARIGSIDLSPDSALRLVETRSGRHRVDLEAGHMRARIWAPPGYFGVSDGVQEVIDLGCEFDLWKQADGSGRLQVRSGWVAYRVAAQEVLVPAGYAVRFDRQGAATPLRADADAGFEHTVLGLEHALASTDASPRAVLAAADAVAHTATDADAFTLLTLLSDHPRLAQGELYPRLARALGASDADAEHRAAWIAGRRHAVDAWWAHLPTQPKNWWAHWTDAFE